MSSEPKEMKMEEKLGEFAANFVYIFERYLEECYTRLENRETKSGKWADLTNKTLEMGKGGTEAFEVDGLKATSNTGIGLLKFVTDGVGNWHNRKELKKLIDPIVLFKNNPENIRAEMVEAAVDIFQNFEYQFMQATADGSWQRAMMKCAEDAVGRVINYIRNSDEELDKNSMTKGVILGQSKRYTNSLCTPNIASGHTVKHGNSDLWKTSEMYENVGLVSLKGNGTTDTYYHKKNNKDSAGKYGYRRLFDWETDEFLKKYVKGIHPEKKYNYILTLEEKQRLKEILLKDINANDPKLMEERLKEQNQDIKRDVENFIQRLDSFLNDLTDIKDTLTNNETQNVVRHQETKQQFEDHSRDNKVQHEKIQDAVEETQVSVKKVEEKLNEVLGLHATNKEKKAIWFDVKSPVVSFTGREQELLDLHKELQGGSDKVTVISQITPVCGLGGIGKTELARRYIQRYSQCYDKNIIWINAEDEASLTDSFYRLASDELEISTKDKDGNNKALNYIVKEATAYFKYKKCLFVFDNVDKPEDVKKILGFQSPKPGDKLPFFLITSRNRDWGKIKVLQIQVLKPEDAIALVKTGLDQSSDTDIAELVEKLQYFPLAIQQAIAHIQDRNEVENFGIMDFLKEYEKKTKELLDSDAFRDFGIDNDYTKTTFTTWNITFETISSNLEFGQLALNILETMAYIAPDKIRRKWFIDLADQDEEKLISAVRLLVKYSLVNEEQKYSVLNIHRLVQEVIRLEIKGRNKSKDVIEQTFEILKHQYPLEKKTYFDFSKEAALEPHLEAFLCHLVDGSEKNPDSRTSIEKDKIFLMLNWVFNSCNYSFNDQLQSKTLDRMLELYEKYDGPDHTGAINYVFECVIEMFSGKDICNRYQKIRKWVAVEIIKKDDKLHQIEHTFFERVLPILEKNYGRDQILVAYAFLWMSLSWFKVGDYCKQKECLHRALEIKTKLFGEDSVKLRTTLIMLSFAYGDSGDQLKRNEYFEKFIEIHINFWKRLQEEKRMSTCDKVEWLTEIKNKGFMEDDDLKKLVVFTEWDEYY